ncbi:MAG: hypothetical protein MR332_00255 [Fusicatenibacter sp.]|nr:hypothetical protein [Fusicatenibacter sp.]
MAQILTWESVQRESWDYRSVERQLSFLVYKLTKLPDFSAERFSYLSKEKDERQAEVAKKQYQMIRGFHNLQSNWGISMRIVKDEQLTLYFVFRYSGAAALTEHQIKEADARIRTTLMQNEYTFQRVEDPTVFDLDWAAEAVEITKEERQETGTIYPVPGMEPQQFYVPYTWSAADNNMAYISSALMSHEGKACIEITLIPTDYLEEEKAWVNINIKRLKDSMNGETICDDAGRRIWKGDPMPVLKIPLDNCEKMNKQYESSRLFLSSIRVFADSQANSLADAFLINSVRNNGNKILYRKGFAVYDYLVNCYKTVDVSANVHSMYWNRNRDTAPYRAQRLNRLVSVEEISNFFRIPIPTQDAFPGFGLDTGLKDFSQKKKIRSIIRLGTYMDEAENDKPAQFDSQQFAKHGLIVGVPGSGKTTAMFNILYQFWAVPEEQRIPFIVLEPAKTEYRALKTLPEFQEDLMVFTLGDEGVSPFRFNPMEVLPGIKIETHISKLQACFVGAFDLFDPLPIFLEQAIRRTYQEKGWYDDSVGGDEGLETPTLSDLCRNAEYIISHSGFDAKMRSDFQASLLERLNSLRRGSKGRMLDTPHTIPMEELMGRPIILELDSLNGDEKSLLMMFLLSYVFEYCKVQRKSGSPLKHMLLVEEAHNLIPAQGGGSDSRANPKGQTIELFVNMLAEMRALGEGILIADQLPTAIAPQAVKQTNVKILMRVTAKDDREEIGNTMDLNEVQMHQVVNFKTGHSYLYHEGEDRVRMLRMTNFKGEHNVEEPPSDQELAVMMKGYEDGHPELYFPYPQCPRNCSKCNRRVRNQAETFVRDNLLAATCDPYKKAFGIHADAFRERGITMTQVCYTLASQEAQRLQKRYGHIGEAFGLCVYIHMLNQASHLLPGAKPKGKPETSVSEWMEKYRNLTGK